MRISMKMIIATVDCLSYSFNYIRLGYEMHAGYEVHLVQSDGQFL